MEIKILYQKSHHQHINQQSISQPFSKQQMPHNPPKRTLDIQPIPSISGAPDSTLRTPNAPQFPPQTSQKKPDRLSPKKQLPPEQPKPEPPRLKSKSAHKLKNGCVLRGRYEIIRSLGCGRYAKVLLVEDLSKRVFRALKVLSQQQFLTLEKFKSLEVGPCFR